MDKSFVKKILAVVMGISLVILIFETVSLISSAVFLGDLKELQSGNLNDVELFMKWSAVGLALMLVPTLTSYAFAFFGKRKFYSLIAAILSFVIVLCCIIFISVCRSCALDSGSSAYASITGYLAEMLQITVASVLIGVYYLLITFLPVKKAETVKSAETVEPVESEQEEAKNEEV